MNRSEIVEIMKDVYTSSEAAEYLNISTQCLHQLVHDKKIEPIKANNSIMLFLKSDLGWYLFKTFGINKRCSAILILKGRCLLA